MTQERGKVLRFAPTIDQLPYADDLGSFRMIVDGLRKQAEFFGTRDVDAHIRRNVTKHAFRLGYRDSKVVETLVYDLGLATPKERISRKLGEIRQALQRS